MTPSQLIELTKRGGDSFHQFKTTFSGINSLAVEISAFANGKGGMIIVGVNDQGSIVGLEQDEIRKLNQWISNASSQKVEPPLFVQTEIIEVEGKNVLLVSVPPGLNKPYCVGKTEFWVKNGADKRRATREELFRLMQSSGRLFADEMVTDLEVRHFDNFLFSEFYKQAYGEDLDELSIDRNALLENLKLIHGDHLTLAGALLFGKEMENLKPQFSVKATVYFDEDDYRDKEDIGGTVFVQYRKGVEFILRNLHRQPVSGDFNSPGELEIPSAAIKEAVANALVHRDYFYNAPVFINVYPDRVEVVSPGNLPNTVSVESIKLGIHMERNPILLSFMAKQPEMGYTGRGSGIPRMIRLCREKRVPLTFENDKNREQFRVIFNRGKKGDNKQ